MNKCCTLLFIVFLVSAMGYVLFIIDVGKTFSHSNIDSDIHVVSITIYTCLENIAYASKDQECEISESIAKNYKASLLNNAEYYVFTFAIDGIEGAFVAEKDNIVQYININLISSSIKEALNERIQKAQ